MNNPLKNDVKRRIKEEVCDPEPREALSNHINLKVDQ